MLSMFTVIAALIVIYFSSYGYALLRNYFNARKSGLPYVFVPWDQDGYFWMAASVPLQPFMQRFLPEWIYTRLSLTIYGHEIREKVTPYVKYATPQGNKDTFVLLTTGRYEVSTRDPEIAIDILKRPRDFLTHELTALFMNRFGPNVLTTDRDTWSRHRKIVASTVNEKISKVVFQESLKQTDGLIDEVMNGKSKCETNGMFDMMKKIAINVLSGASMGASVEWNDNANGEPQDGFKLTYIQAVKILVQAVAGPIILPQWFLRNYPRNVPGHKFLGDLSHAIDEFPVHTRDLLEQERQRSVAGETTNSIMSQLIAASEAENKSGQSLSESEQIGNLFIFTVAGFDTTANTLAFSLVLLARYPEWQDWLYEEIRDIVPNDGAEMDYTTVYPKASRVMACMLETLRLYPPLSHIARQTKVEQTIQTSTGTYYFPAKAAVYVNIYALHLEPSVWRNINLADGEEASNDDENRFRPSRWIVKSNDGSQSLHQPPKGMYIPWSGGPRVCPGQKMAQVEFTAIFLKLFSKYRVEAVPRKSESRKDLEKRLEGKLEDAGPVLVLQMRGVYDVGDGEEEGVRMKLCKRV
ncbi:uncharacterized protein RCC_07790 [Ramularia collo-cygni]|uniref:Cytochrome P450 n=1 Tax=Ramularia collo-cygni TaxID=112498 RepID=A0A2D3VL74_9PEZI|nr:uncharacterized protein RCC_07790 [Ramularia collo-cygni]CZT21923.1 uncharacterized protein RCC_07790 [Ramularia collo-cygni]